MQQQQGGKRKSEKEEIFSRLKRLNGFRFVSSDNEKFYFTYYLGGQYLIQADMPLLLYPYFKEYFNLPPLAVVSTL